jgi:hypothetical protein
MYQPRKRLSGKKYPGMGSTTLPPWLLKCHEAANDP